MNGTTLQQVLVDEKEEHQVDLADSVRRPATESLVHTKLIAEGLFDVSRTSGGRGTAGSSPFDQFAGKLPRVNGRNRGDPTRPPDAFDVSAAPACRVATCVYFFLHTNAEH